VQLADREAKRLDGRSRIVWAGGRLLNGAAMADPAEADTWDFNALALDGSTIAGMWELTLLVEQWRIRELEHPPMEIEYIDLTTIPMDVHEAWEILRQQGLARPFFTWELFKPLNPELPNPCYAFYLGGQYLFVDVVSRTVSAAGARQSIPAGIAAGAYAGGAAASVGSAPSVAMISEAARRVQLDFPQAIVVQAEGASAAESMDNPAQTDRWSFTAVDQAEVPLKPWELYTADGIEWTMTPGGAAPQGILFLDLTGIWMDVTAAWELVESAGLAARFSRWRLSFPDESQRPRFVFSKLGAGSIYVDALSGQAWED